MPDQPLPTIDGKQLSEEALQAQAAAALEPGALMVTVVSELERPVLYRVRENFGRQRGIVASAALVLLEAVEPDEARAVCIEWRAKSAERWRQAALESSPASV